MGSCFRRSGLGESVRVEVSTGMDRGGRGCEGVAFPGVAGGVKAGEMIELGSCWRAATRWSPGSDGGADVVKNSLRPGLEGCGEYSGGRPGEAWEGRAGMTCVYIYVVAELEWAMGGKEQATRGWERAREEEKEKESELGSKLPSRACASYVRDIGDTG